MTRFHAAVGASLMLSLSGAYANEADARKFMAYCEHELNDTKNYDEAGKICKRVREDIKVLLGISPLYLQSIVNEADSKWALGNYPEAFNLYSEAADVAIKLGDINKVRELRIRQAEAELFRGKSFEAEILLRDALRRLQSSRGSNPLQEADLLSRHAEVLVTLGQAKAAMQGYLAAFAKLDADSIKHRPILLKTQLRYAELFERQSRYSGATASYLKLLQLASSKPTNPEYVAIAYGRLGWISETLDKPADALSYYRRQLEVIEKDPAQVAAVDELRKKIIQLEKS
ncbi:MAG: tetratricopeptide repeat protein [Gammaproteobacteria bacterium]|jgi:tetratricopeptide (TPR) repeat protein|nr:tetratricopeptide repeat protein [Gammaproteobacteria bacterium]